MTYLKCLLPALYARDLEILDNKHDYCFRLELDAAHKARHVGLGSDCKKLL
jgi:hypothetical protein